MIEPLPRQRQALRRHPAARARPSATRSAAPPDCAANEASARRASEPTSTMSSARTGTAISAAAVGVGARRSAAKSISVTSVSWPTAEISGMKLAAAARTTISSLNDHRSSSEPPPRATMIRSGRGSAPCSGKRVEAVDRGGDFGGRALALHFHRPDQNAARKAVGEPMQDVADHGAGRRGDDADHRRQITAAAVCALRRTDLRRRASCLRSSRSAISAPRPAGSSVSTMIWYCERPG